MSHVYRNYRDGLYRSRHGLLFGVCAGIAERFDLSVFWTRIVMAILILTTGLFPGVALYVLGVLLMKRRPAWH